jgi:hypothetical protein
MIYTKYYKSDEIKDEVGGHVASMKEMNSTKKSVRKCKKIS